MTTIEQAREQATEALKGVGYDARALPHSLRVVHLIDQIECEVSMGGVHGWLSNAGGDGPDVVEAFDAIGAHQCAGIVREILSFFPGGAPAIDDQARGAQLESMPDDVFDRWRDLGLRLLSWPDDIYVLMQRFIDEHQQDFAASTGASTSE